MSFYRSNSSDHTSDVAERKNGIILKLLFKVRKSKKKIIHASLFHFWLSSWFLPPLDFTLQRPHTDRLTSKNNSSKGNYKLLFMFLIEFKNWINHIKQQIWYILNVKIPFKLMIWAVSSNDVLYFTKEAWPCHTSSAPLFYSTKATEFCYLLMLSSTTCK